MHPEARMEQNAAFDPAARESIEPFSEEAAPLREPDTNFMTTDAAGFSRGDYDSGFTARRDDMGLLSDEEESSMKRVRDTRRKVVSLWVELGSVELQEGESPLAIKVEWNPEWKSQVDDTLREINMRLAHKGAEFVDDDGHVHRVTRRVTEGLVVAVAATICNRLKNLVLAFPTAPSRLRARLRGS